MASISIKLFTESPTPASALQETKAPVSPSHAFTPQGDAPTTPQADSHAQDPRSAAGSAAAASSQLAATPSKSASSTRSQLRRKSRGVVSPPPFSLPDSPENSASASAAAGSAGAVSNVSKTPTGSAPARSASSSGSARRRSAAHRQMAAALGAVPRSFDFDDLVASSAAAAALARAKALHQARTQQGAEQNKAEDTVAGAALSVPQSADRAPPPQPPAAAASPASSEGSAGCAEAPSPPFLQPPSLKDSTPQAVLLEPALAAVQAESPDSPPSTPPSGASDPPLAVPSTPTANAASTGAPHATSPQRSTQELLARGLPLRPKSLSPQRTASAAPAIGQGGRQRGGALQVSARGAASAPPTAGASAPWHGPGGLAPGALGPSPTSSEEEELLASFMDTPDTGASAGRTPQAATPKRDAGLRTPPPEASSGGRRLVKAPGAPLHPSPSMAVESDAGSSSPDLSPSLPSHAVHGAPPPLHAGITESPPSTPRSMNELLAARAERRRLQRGWSPSRGAPSSAQGHPPIRALDLSSASSPVRVLPTAAALDRGYSSTTVSSYTTAHSTTVCLASQGDSSDDECGLPVSSAAPQAVRQRPARRQRPATPRSSARRASGGSAPAAAGRGSRELRRLMQDLAWHGPTIAAAAQRGGSGASARDARRKAASSGGPSMLELVATAALAQGREHRYSAQCTDEVQRLLQEAVAAADCSGSDSHGSTDQGAEEETPPTPPPTRPAAVQTQATRRGSKRPRGSNADTRRNKAKQARASHAQPAPGDRGSNTGASGTAAQQAAGARVHSKQRSEPVPAKRRPVRSAVLRRDEFAQRDAFLGTFPSRGGVVP